MQADDVAFGKQFVQFHLLDFGWQLEVRFGGIGTHLHAEADGDACGSHAGVAQADDTHLLAGQFDERCVPEAEVGTVGPAAFVYFFGVVLHLLGNVQQVGKDHLGHGVGTVGGNVGNGDATFFGGSSIYDVVSGSHHTDVFQLGQGGHVFGCNDHFVGEKYVGTFGAFHYFCGGGTVIDDTFAQLLHFVPGEVSGIGGIAVERYNFHVIQILNIKYQILFFFFIVSMVAVSSLISSLQSLSIDRNCFSVR